MEKKQKQKPCSICNWIDKIERENDLGFIVFKKRNDIFFFFVLKYTACRLLYVKSIFFSSNVWSNSSPRNPIFPTLFFLLKTNSRLLLQTLFTLFFLLLPWGDFPPYSSQAPIRSVCFSLFFFFLPKKTSLALNLILAGGCDTLRMHRKVEGGRSGYIVVMANARGCDLGSSYQLFLG